MWKILLLTFILVGIAVLLLGVRIFFFKGGKFPSSHIGDNEALRKKGIHCAKTQDQQAQASLNIDSKK
ncbi:MAG: hypothetical protein LBR52_01365 [Prevotellaceae bacterium]|jgi:hypothetical protein|nr:hypothetical protein [Prevotellaceae bacterium]